jgi:hypothetical protein
MLTFRKLDLFLSSGKGAKVPSYSIGPNQVGIFPPLHLITEKHPGSEVTNLKILQDRGHFQNKNHVYLHIHLVSNELQVLGIYHCSILFKWAKHFPL